MCLSGENDYEDNFWLDPLYNCLFNTFKHLEKLSLFLLLLEMHVWQMESELKFQCLGEESI